MVWCLMMYLGIGIIMAIFFDIILGICGTMESLYDSFNSSVSAVLFRVALWLYWIMAWPLVIIMSITFVKKKEELEVKINDEVVLKEE